MIKSAIALGLLVMLALVQCAFALTVESDFEGASVRVVQTDDATQTIRFMPGGDPARGWPCWWYFRASGLSAGKTLTLELAGSDTPMPQANGQPSDKPLPAGWAMPVRASFSQDDGRTWQRTEPGRKQDGRMIYTVEPKETSVLVAWGPPYTPAHAAEFVRGIAAGSASAKATELCRSREGRSVPMLRVSEGDRAEAQRFGVWVQARQHAWESGSSWVAQGFAEWLLGADSEAVWLRQHAEIFIVPIMDIDNTATGNGGKEALPQDHNRDWSEKPNWNEVAAAQRSIGELVKQGRMDFFFDLHNPGPTDSQAFFFATAGEHLSEQARAHQAAFVPIARAEIAPAMPMLEQPKPVGPSYHPLWRQTSFTWVHAHGNPQTVSLCLETPWNTERSSVEGYKVVGAGLAKAAQRYLIARAAERDRKALPTNPPTKLQSFFAPPAEFAGQRGSYASPLRFYDGRPVATPAEWPARRAEILKYWHEQMGPWPELLARPKLELLEKDVRDGITQHRVQIEVAPGVMQHGFLLVPAGNTPRPAVLVPYYVPEVSVDYQGPLEGHAKKMMEGGHARDRDFAWQLARRGFVTLAIGSPGGDARQPLTSGARCQPLSYLAYIAANCHTALAQRPEVDPARIGVMGHSYGGKWAMFASCLYEKFASGVWSDGGIVFDESRGNVNYWEPWYLGFDSQTQRKPGLISSDNPRTGAYKTIFESGHDLHELHALMAPRPFLVSGGSEDFPARWVALNHAIAVNRFLGHENRVAMTNRPDHSPNAESNEQAFQFLEFVLGPVAVPENSATPPNNQSR